MKRSPGVTPVAVAVALSTFWSAAAAQAQTDGGKGGFAVREVSLSTGYGAVQLPPITLGGFLPDDVLDVDLVTSGAARVDWSRATPRTHSRLELFGAYTGRARYSRLNAPAASVSAGVSRAVGYRWRLGAGGASALVSSDQASFQRNGIRRRVDDAVSFDDFARTASATRSPHPDPAAAAQFVPISQTLAGADLYVNRVVASSVEADASYINSPRLVTYFHGQHTSVRRVSSNDTPAQRSLFPDSRAEGAGVRVIYRSSERSRLTAAAGYSQAVGAFTYKGVASSLGYGWSGRKWFAEATIGGLLPLETDSDDAPLTADGDRPLALTYSAGLGYKFRTQTLLVQYVRAPHDEYGHGGRSAATGFEGDVQSLVGAWSRTSTASRWVARADIAMVRRPGNFSYIYAWLATAGVGRQLGPDVRLMGEILFDRHGSRGFEGFHMMHESARLKLVWTPSRRAAASTDRDR